MLKFNWRSKKTGRPTTHVRVTFSLDIHDVAAIVVAQHPRLSPTAEEVMEEIRSTGYTRTKVEELVRRDAFLNAAEGQDVWSGAIDRYRAEDWDLEAKRLEMLAVEFVGELFPEARP